MLLHVKEITGPQVVVAITIVRVNRCRLNRHLHTRVREIIRLPVRLDVEIFKFAFHFRDHHMFDGKVDGAMGWVDLIRFCHKYVHSFGL